jgi:AraC family transcriptional regulator
MDSGASDAKPNHLLLQSRIGDYDQADTVSKTWGAFTVEHVRVKQKSSYDFRLRSRKHYVAIHDIKRVDGETFVSGLPRCTLKDLRDKITYITKDCEAAGWAELGPRASFTAVYYSDEDRHQLPPGALPYLHFSSDFLRSLLRKIEALTRAEDSGNSLYAESLCTVLFHDVASMQGAAEPAAPSIRGGLTPRTFKIIDDFLNDNLSAKITLDELANIAGISRYHFVRSFKQTTGTSPNQYLISLRIDRAKRLLAETTLSVGEVAPLVGFGSGTHLTKTFRLVIGITPSDFRRRLS